MIARMLVLLAVAGTVVACSDDPTTTATAPTTSSGATTTTTIEAATTTIVFNTVAWTTVTDFVIPIPSTTFVPSALPELREELLAMFRQDQLERTGAGLPPGAPLPQSHDYQRTQRLREIIAERGWPTVDMVGVDGAQAAWLIAQHSDHDVGFQRTALELMRVAVEAGQADASEYAFLEDRVAVNSDQPQRYGTQVRCIDGGPGPSTPLIDPVNVDAIRAAVGLEPLAEYYTQFPSC